MDDLIKRARAEWADVKKEGPGEERAAMKILWSNKNAEALLAHAEAQASALAVAREALDGLIEVVMKTDRRNAKGVGIARNALAQLNALEDNK